MKKLMKLLVLQIMAAGSVAVLGASGVSAFDECPQPWGETFFVACYPTPAFCWNAVDQENNACTDFGCMEDQENCPGSTGQVALWGITLEYQNMP